jgi:hypothetical protein
MILVQKKDKSANGARGAMSIYVHTSFCLTDMLP